MNASVEYIREAIRREEYCQALAQWNSYAGYLRTAVEAGTLSPEQFREARALFEWARPCVLGGRERLRLRIQELEVSAAYGQPSAVQLSRLNARL